jgi:hypothetical protein
MHVELHSFILGLPSLGSSVAFFAAMPTLSGSTDPTVSKSGSVNPFLLSTNYPIMGIPIALRVIYADRFVRGPFHLGKFS